MVLFMFYKIKFEICLELFMVPENIHTPTAEGHWQFQDGGGGAVLKAKIFEEKYEPKLKFQRGGGFKQPSMGGVWIFSGTTHFDFRHSWE